MLGPAALHLDDVSGPVLLIRADLEQVRLAPQVDPCHRRPKANYEFVPGLHRSGLCGGHRRNGDNWARLGMAAGARSRAPSGGSGASGEPCARRPAGLGTVAADASRRRRHGDGGVRRVVLHNYPATTRVASRKPCFLQRNVATVAAATCFLQHNYPGGSTALYFLHRICAG